jgi:hypothetical protein
MKIFSWLSTLPNWSLVLSLVIAATSGINVFSAGKTVKERVLAAVLCVLALALLVVQFISSKQSAAAAQSQSSRSQKQMIAATLGSDLCPTIMVDRMANQRPQGVSVFNPDKDANIYDLVLYVQEGEHTPDGRGFRTLQQRTLRFPTVPPGSGSTSVPFEFLSERNTAYLQFDLSTRRKICSGLIVLRGDGNGSWSTTAYPVHEGPLTSHETEIPMTDQN